MPNLPATPEDHPELLVLFQLLYKVNTANEGSKSCQKYSHVSRIFTVKL